MAVSGRNEGSPAGGGEAAWDVAPGCKGAYEEGPVGLGQRDPAEEEGRAVAVPHLQAKAVQVPRNRRGGERMRDREKRAAASIEKAFKGLMEVQRREKEGGVPANQLNATRDAIVLLVRARALLEEKRGGKCGRT